MRAGHEKRDFSPALILKVGAGLLIVVIATMLMSHGLRILLSKGGEDLNDHPTTPQIVVDKTWNLDSYG